jgi:hypothetical protein
LAGDFDLGEENIKTLAFRRDTDIDMSDSESKEIFCEAIEDDRVPMAIRQELIRAVSSWKLHMARRYIRLPSTSPRTNQ